MVNIVDGKITRASNMGDIVAHMRQIRVNFNELRRIIASRISLILKMT